MSSEPDGKRSGAALWLILKGVALIATGLLAGVGMTFVCAMGGVLQSHDRVFRLSYELPIPMYAAFFAGMLIWAFSAVRFAWRNRTWLGLILSAVAFVVFGLNAVNVLKFAYPVCNAF